jgi:hypothetical protein
MGKLARIAAGGVLMTCMLGCENMQKRTESATAIKNRNGGVAVKQVAANPTVDDAALVMARCGMPATDEVFPIYNHLNNGPVRKVLYRGKHTVLIEFIPSHPILKDTVDQRRPLKGTEGLPKELPAGSVWRFDAAMMKNEEEAITADRLAFLLPCASKALHPEY